jgi:hypothetical protein
MRRHRSLVLSLAVGLSLIASASTASATSLCSGIAGNLVLNCGFDQGSTPVNGGQDPTDWTAAQFTGFEAIVGSPVNGSDTNSMRIANDEFQGGEPLFNGSAIMSQSFTTVLGDQYSFDFYVLNGDPGGGDEQFQAFWGPSSSPTSGSPVFLDTGSLGGSFTLEQFTVTGSGSDTITFTSYNSPNYYYLADVSLVDNGAPNVVPEPGTVVLMGLGLAFLLLGGRQLKLNGTRAA